MVLTVSGHSPSWTPPDLVNEGFNVPLFRCHAPEALFRERCGSVYHSFFVFLLNLPGSFVGYNALFPPRVEVGMEDT